MPFTVGFMDDKGIVIIENIGELTYTEFLEQTQEAIELGRTKNAGLYLSDCTRLIAKENMIEVLDLPLEYEKLCLPRSSKVAVLMPEDLAGNKLFEFYETYCLNRGWQIRLFRVKDEAIEWLVG